MIDKKVLKLHFGRNAANYDIYAKVQKNMAHEIMNQICLNSKDKEFADILDVGCGTGYMTSKLLQAYPNARITALDIAPGMIEYAKRNIKGNNIEFICEDIEEVKIEKKYDLIVSNATFQWLNDLKATVSLLGNMLKDNGMIAAATFGNMTFYELHKSYEIAKKNLNVNIDLLPGQKFFSRDEFLKVCNEALQESNISDKYRICGTDRNECEYFDTVRAFLKAVKKIGANNSNNGPRIGMAVTREMMNVYKKEFSESGKVKASYHCIFFIAEKLKKGS